MLPAAGGFSGRGRTGGKDSGRWVSPAGSAPGQGPEPTCAFIRPVPAKARGGDLLRPIPAPVRGRSTPGALRQLSQPRGKRKRLLQELNLRNRTGKARHTRRKFLVYRGEGHTLGSASLCQQNTRTGRFYPGKKAANSAERVRSFFGGIAGDHRLSMLTSFQFPSERAAYIR